MADYVLTVAAVKDLARTIEYSLRVHGPVQAARYDATLRQALATLGELPNPGTPYRRGKRVYYWLPVGETVLVYRLVKGAARVTRILHRRMLPPSNLR